VRAFVIFLSELIHVLSSNGLQHCQILMKIASIQTFRELSVLATKTDRLAGTVPLHQAYILLHGRRSPRTFPSRVTSPLLLELQRHALRWSALVNVAWIPSNAVGIVPNPSEGVGVTDTYNLLAFSRDRARLQIPSVSMDNLEDVCTRLNDHMKGLPTSMVDPDPSGLLFLYVCTHGARDCRCGEWGTKVADALREEVRRRKEKEPTGKYSRVVVGEAGHVGGHQ
jgi:Sucrase/ferredoxin-like